MLVDGKVEYTKFEELVGLEYQMVGSLRIENFRCFRKVELSNLAKINIIVGDNGQGKTAFLEALYMAGGRSPEIFFRTRLWRGMGERFEIAINKTAYEAFFRNLFHRLDQNQKIQVELKDSARKTRQLEIFYEEELEINVPFDVNAIDEISINPIVFLYKGLSPNSRSHNLAA